MVHSSALRSHGKVYVYMCDTPQHCEPARAVEVMDIFGDHITL